MKQIATAIFLLVSLAAFSTSADDNLNAGLMPIYESLRSTGDSSEILDREFTVGLSLKFASEDHLIFHDAFIEINEFEKYQIAKWQFDPNIVASIIGKSNIKCTVTFRISEVRKTGQYATIPHVVGHVLRAESDQIKN